MDGFWAFEMEHRGAEQVVAIDIDDPEALDWPHSLRHTTSREIDATKRLRFNLAKEALGSSVSRVLRSVYELDTELGLFDLIVCGDLLLHLKDPLTALERLVRVCRGSAVVCTPIVRVRFGGRKPLAIFDGSTTSNGGFRPTVLWSACCVPLALQRSRSESPFFCRQLVVARGRVSVESCGRLSNFL